MNVRICDLFSVNLALDFDEQKTHTTFFVFCLRETLAVYYLIICPVLFAHQSRALADL